MRRAEHAEHSSSEDSAEHHLAASPGSFEFQRKRRKRTTAAQLALLETHFANDMLPSNETRAALADRLGMSPRRVQIWFQNKRAKNKRIQRESHRRSEDEPVSSDGPRSKVICVETSRGVVARRTSAPEPAVSRSSPSPASAPVVVVPQAQSATLWPRTLPSLAELHLSAEARGGYANTATVSAPIKLPPLRNLVDVSPMNLGNVVIPFSRPAFFPASA